VTFVVALLCLALGVGFGWWRWGARPAAADALARRSRVLYELAEGDNENVAQELEEIAEQEPGDATIFLALAALDRGRGRVERAKSIHRTVLASAELPSEHRVAALVGLGRDLLAQGNERAAVGALVRAASLAPRSVATLETLARALEQAGAWERAAAAWERLEKQVDGRRAREARVGRGHAVAGQALDALRESEDRKARRLAERAIDLAPDSGHAWYVRARVEAALGESADALDAWQRAWELTPAGAPRIVGEAWRWASELGRHEDLMERMLASLRVTTDPDLIVPLADHVSRQHPDQAVAALERIGERSSAARLAQVRLHLGRGQRAEARDAAMQAPARGGLLCRSCGTQMPAFSFRCDHCGGWDSATTEGVGVEARTPAL
jgi:lipopolysaccharide biosynthesis regulator YciM